MKFRNESDLQNEITCFFTYLAILISHVISKKLYNSLVLLLQHSNRCASTKLTHTCLKHLTNLFPAEIICNLHYSEKPLANQSCVTAMYKNTHQPLMVGPIRQLPYVVHSIPNGNITLDVNHWCYVIKWQIWVYDIQDASLALTPMQIQLDCPLCIITFSGVSAIICA